MFKLVILFSLLCMAYKGHSSCSDHIDHAIKSQTKSKAIPLTTTSTGIMSMIAGGASIFAGSSIIGVHATGMGIISLTTGISQFIKISKKEKTAQQSLKELQSLYKEAVDLDGPHLRQVHSMITTSPNNRLVTIREVADFIDQQNELEIACEMREGIRGYMNLEAIASLYIFKKENHE